MARGWESKAVEEQMEEAARDRASAAGTEPSPTPEALELRRRRESLRLSRARVVEQISGARSEAHRRLLSRSLEALDQQLAALERVSSLKLQRPDFTLETSNKR
jgi:hypothetical protein